MVIKCSKGHWYDSSVHKTCPYCLRESEKLGIGIDNLQEDDKTIAFADIDLNLGKEINSIIENSIDDDMDSDDDKTISFGFFGATNTQPVVGWLVSVEGSDKGKDFRLHSGKNFVGRSTSLDVVLIDDKKISRDKHCAVTYDPKGNTFWITAEGGNVVYVNDEMVGDAIKIEEGASIKIGETELVFIPFCKEERTWENE